MPRTIRLEQLVIREACPEDWGAMAGDERRRFCSRCRKHVHDLGALPRREAEELVSRGRGDLCVRMPAARHGRCRRAGRALLLPLAALLVVALLAVGLARGLREGSALHAAYEQAKGWMTGWWSPAANPPVLMGAIAVTPMGKVLPTPPAPAPPPTLPRE